jgi:hypothetical protein
MSAQPIAADTAPAAAMASPTFCLMLLLIGLIPAAFVMYCFANSLYSHCLVLASGNDAPPHYDRVLVQYSDCIQNQTIAVGIQSWHNYCRNTVRNFLLSKYSRNTVALCPGMRPRI